VKKAQTLSEYRREIGLEINPENNKWMVVSRSPKYRTKSQITGGNRSFENAAKFKYLATTEKISKLHSQGK
jgi:hypothetical protein